MEWPAGASPAAAVVALGAAQRIADEPERRRPQPDEQGAALGVAALVLVDGLRADPQRDAQSDGAHRDELQVVAAQADRADGGDEHLAACVPRCWPRHAL